MKKKVVKPLEKEEDCRKEKEQDDIFKEQNLKI